MDIRPSDQLVQEAAQSPITTAANGLMSSIQGYMGGQLQAQAAGATADANAQREIQKQTAIAKAKHDIDNPVDGSQVSYLSPDMAEKALPGYGANMVNDYNHRNPNATLTINQGADYIEKAHTMLQANTPDTSKEDSHQDQLEKQYNDRKMKVFSNRSGGLGLQDSKVNQAYDLRTLVNQYYNPKTDEYTIPPAQHSELALGLARLLSPQGTVPIELEKQIRQSTGREAIAKALIYAGADPSSVGGPTQSVVKMFVDSIDRQGTTAERLRDHYMEGIKELAPTNLKPAIKAKSDAADLTNSYTKLLNESPDHQRKLDHPIGKVMVTNKEGQKGFIPASQLEAALKSGYKQVQ